MPVTSNGPKIPQKHAINPVYAIVGRPSIGAPFLSSDLSEKALSEARRLGAGLTARRRVWSGLATVLGARGRRVATARPPAGRWCACRGLVNGCRSAQAGQRPRAA